MLMACLQYLPALSAEEGGNLLGRQRITPHLFDTRDMCQQLSVIGQDTRAAMYVCINAQHDRQSKTNDVSAAKPFYQ